jgi:hypothetical protein
MNFIIFFFYNRIISVLFIALATLYTVPYTVYIFVYVTMDTNGNLQISI